MSVNFKINIPSIPTNKIRFKIQDVRQKGFLTKDNRFKENKEYLTKKFINSFANLSPKKEVHHQQQNFYKSQMSTNPSSYFQKQSDNYRWMIGQNKKNLLIKYEDKYKNYLPPIIQDQKYNKGYSFSKSVAHDTLDTQIQKQYSVQLDKKSQHRSFQNYYFNQSQNQKTQISEEDSQDDHDDQEKSEKTSKKLQKKKFNRPSAAFQGEDRWEFFQRSLKNQIKIGPGHYNPQVQKRNWQKSIKKKRQLSQKNQQQEAIIPIQKLRAIIQSIVEQSNNYQANCQQTIDNKLNSSNNQTSSFVLNNSDRFGSPVYPIVSKLKVPGPGAYQCHNSIQQNSKKLLILQQQRILLKQWYNQQ